MVKLTQCLCVAALLFGSTLAFAQSPQPQTYGTQGEIAYVIPATVFSPSDSNVTWHSYGPNSGIKFVGNNNGCCLDGPVSLPSGAVITGIEIEGCDSSTTAQLAGSLAICTVSSIPCATSAIVSSGISASPNCSFFRVNFSPTLTVNNATNTYFFEFSNDGDTTGVVYLVAARVFYKLQVSPAPATASFNDVPTTHAFFQYIEALASAGITAGCGGGNFCPDAPLTRGQMAVFLARALGLHWVP